MAAARPMPSEAPVSRMVCLVSLHSNTVCFNHSSLTYPALDGHVILAPKQAHACDHSCQQSADNSSGDGQRNPKPLKPVHESFRTRLSPAPQEIGNESWNVLSFAHSPSSNHQLAGAGPAAGAHALAHVDPLRKLGWVAKAACQWGRSSPRRKADKKILPLLELLKQLRTVIANSRLTPSPTFLPVSNSFHFYLPLKHLSIKMAKKRKATRPAEPQGPKEIDPKDARLTVNNYMDVADSEDEYWYKKDRLDIDSDDEPRSKRLKRQDKEDAFLEQSDEEIFDDESSSEEEEEEDDEDERRAPTKKDGKKGAALDDDDDAELLGLGKKKDDDEIRDEGWWGSSKKEYYNADAIETEQDALVRWIIQFRIVLGG
jgi:AAA ATPase containing von Willebrand factor type A (vWA) domain